MTADIRPIKLVTTAPKKLQRMVSGDTVAADTLPAATSSVQGAVILSDAAPPTIAAANSQGSSTQVAREDHTHAHGAQTDGSMHAAAIAAGASGFMTGSDKTKLDGIASGAELNVGESLTSSNPNEAAAGELAIYTGKSGSTLQFRSLSGERGIEAEVVGSSIRVQRATSLWAPAARSVVEAYRPKRLRSRRTAGAVGDAGGSDPWYPAKLTDNHGATDHLYPYMVPTGVDYYGLPHNGHARLRGSNAGNDSGEKGYEFGHDVAAGDARARSRFEWKLSGKFENVGWNDAFIECAVDINPTVAVYNSANLARLVSPDLAAVGVGEKHFVGRVFLEVTGPDSWDVWGEFRIYSSTGAVIREWSRVASVSGADHNWLRDAARLQMRWRVERDQATRLDVFDGFNQGARQGSNLLRLHVDAYEYTPILAEIS